MHMGKENRVGQIDLLDFTSNLRLIDWLNQYALIAFRIGKITVPLHLQLTNWLNGFSFVTLPYLIPTCHLIVIQIYIDSKY